MKKLFILLAVLICGNLFAQKSQQELNQLMQQRNEFYFSFELSGNDDLATIARTISVDRVDGNTVIAYANNNEFSQFQKLGYQVTLMTPPSMLFEAEMWDGNNRAAYDWDQYPTYEAYENMMYQFGTDHPDKCEIIELGTLPSNRKILIAHINNGDGTGKPKFLYTSTIHGDETTGWMLMLRFIDYLLENPTLPECANVLNNVDLYIGPNTNPDGTYHGGNNTVNGATRYNANGIDMNRNYADPHGSLHPDGEAYAQETEWFMQFAQENNFVMGANYHGGAEVMNYPWDNTYTLHADDQWYQLISHEYADLTHQVSSSYMTDYNNGVTNGAQWYMIGGGRQDYMNGYAQCRELTIECSNTKCPNGSQMPTFWNYNKNSIFAFVNQCLNGIHGTVVDAESKAPIGGATVTLVGHDDQYSTVSTQLPGGDFHRPVKAGTYNVRITKNGYEAYETQVTVADGAAITINAELVALEGIVADFTADVTAVAVGGSVHFTDNSWGAQLTNWNWEFEGGTPATSTAQNPTVTYNQAGNFGVRLTVINADGESDTKYMPNYISASEAYNMQSGTITTCDAMFYDDGGPSNNYGNNKDLTLTFLPATEGGFIEVTFQTFDTESNYDFLYIYDGTSTSAPQIGQYDGGNSPGTVTATNAQGALTFRFTSDSSVNREGWSAHVSCLGVLAPIVVTVTAEPESILTGQTSHLSAVVTGGSGVYTYHWEPADMVSNANIANPQTVELFETQTFNLTVSDDQGNTGTGSVTIDVTSGVNVNENQADKVQVYPNPVSSTLFIDGLNGFSNLDVQIVSIQGQVIKEVVNSLEINVSNIESGIYFIKIECDGQQYLKKFIVK
ncbi:MAG: T9SS type A sorting domain-containing protein [Bacteroidales bacterium]|nr:T9SS type A sorting domain-containing protein [Bacteroidales bacterium]